MKNHNIFIIIGLLLILAILIYKLTTYNKSTKETIIKIDTITIIHTDTITKTLKPSVITKKYMVYRDSVKTEKLQVFITDTLRDSIIVRDLQYKIKEQTITKTIEINKNNFYLSGELSKSSLSLGFDYTIKNKFILGAGILYFNKPMPFIKLGIKL